MNSRHSLAIIFAVIFWTFTNLPAASHSEGDIKVISSDSRSVTIEYKPVYNKSSKILINNEEYLRIDLSKGVIPDDAVAGSPLLPLRSLSLGVPEEFGNTIEILETGYTDIQGKPAPKPTVSVKTNLPEYSYSLSDTYYSSAEKELVSFGDFGLVRDIPLQTINISPVKFIPGQNKIRQYTRIVFKLNYSSNQNLSGNPSTDVFLSDAILNFANAKYWHIGKAAKLNKTVRINSVLSSGRWFRFEATEEGIYKITASTLNTIGIDPSSVDPKTIKVYNNGGKMLNENLTVRRPADLVENATYLSKTVDDGRFNDGDYILFYGRGIHFWDYDTLTGKVVRYFHNYSKSNYYFLTFGGTAGKRVVQKAGGAQVTDTISTTPAYTAWEEDKARLMNSGRLYMGDDFLETQTSRTYLTSLSGIIPNSTVTYKFNFVNRAEANASLKIDENSVSIYNAAIYGVGIGQLENAEAYRGISLNGETAYKSAWTDERSVLKFTYVPNSAPAIGYLNSFELYFRKQLKAYSDHLTFYSPDVTAGVEYHLSGFSNSDFKVFDVTDYSNLKLIINPAISGGDCIFQVSETKNKVSKYLAVGLSSYKLPLNFTEITNSNLHGAADEGTFIIITYKNFLEQAKRLKAHKESLKYKVSTVVVDIQDIFNEFSSGMQDVSAIRDYIKYAYDNWSIKPEYVLLLGDGDYDYKNISGKNQNFIIPYESLNSYHSIESYVSDDFYACVSGNDLVVDLALGRINVTSVTEAQAAVDKIIRYETASAIGTWRNLITLVADDGYTSSGYEGAYHNEQSESISRLLPASYDQHKIYEAQYPSVQTGAGKRKPQVNKAIINAINDGSLIINWIGHGNPDVWAHEYVFEKGTTIPQLVNDKYCFLIAATCDFGRYDTPEEQSSTEMMLLKADGGTIGSLTSARTVYSLDNFQLASDFYSNLFIKDTTGLIRPIGKSYMLTKMHNYQLNDRKYHLFGDPTIRLVVPEIPVSIDSINGKPASSAIAVKALSKLKVDGSIHNMDSSFNSTFNGECIVTVYDSQRQVPVADLNGMEITLQGGIIYKGIVSVTGGKFSTEFTVPKDISYENTNGKIVAYIYSGASDGVGFSNNIVVGGTDSTIVNDKKGPQVDIAFDDVNGDNSMLVKPDFTLYVRLKDETGLNTTGTGIGHKTEGILNGNENVPIDFSNYFIGDLNAGGKSGAVKYKFSNMEAGDYRIRVKAWDVFNNNSEAEKGFTVVNTSGLALNNLYNFPNPFKEKTTFTFQHNMNSPVNVKIKIYTVAGRNIKTIESSGVSDRFVKLDWDGRDQDGNMIANGTYLYKVIVKTTDDSYSHEVLGKLAVVR
ncbi:MAG: type IX secretion system sortase PorU [Ignavibacteria bacterium]